MKTLLTTLVLLASLGGGGTANAAWSTKDWVNACGNKNNQLHQAFCLSYARGVADAFDLWVAGNKDSAPICIPDVVTAGQLVAVGLKFYKESPKDRHLMAGEFLGYAFLDAWPCDGMVRKGTAYNK